MGQGQGEAERVTGSRTASKYMWGREFSAQEENAGVQGRKECWRMSRKEMGKDYLGKTEK